MLHKKLVVIHNKHENPKWKSEILVYELRNVNVNNTLQNEDKNLHCIISLPNLMGY